MIEAPTDPKTLFAPFSALDNVPNSLTDQQTLILASFGFSALQTTLLSCVPAIIEISTIFTGVRRAAWRPNSRAYVTAICFVPAWLVYLAGQPAFLVESGMWLTSAIYLVVLNITHYAISDWTPDQPVPEYVWCMVWVFILIARVCLGSFCHWYGLIVWLLAIVRRR